ncbi:MAG: carbohydrate porin, partial [Betaproteobacteria bacterium]
MFHCWLPFLATAVLLAPSLPAHALGDTPAPSSSVDEADSTARFQVTYIWQRKSAFGAAYSGTNSLTPEAERRSYTFSATAFLGTRLWHGGELYINPELISSQSLSGLHGLGGMSNGENQKGGGPSPIVYLARLFVRHTWNLDGGSDAVESGPNQIPGTADKRRLTATVGKISLIDIFDGNSVAHDPRTQFLNWSLIAHGAYDYAADSRGYTVGAALEYNQDAWAVRVGRFAQPKESNGLPLDSRLAAHYGDQFEIERSHMLGGQPGKLRFLTFRNMARMGGFSDAVGAWNTGGQAGVPNVADVRREQIKVGFGIGAEQSVGNDVGLFLRASSNDGGEETYAFTEIERSTFGGVSLRGNSWGRPEDNVGLAYVRNGLSSAHRRYLANGGLGAFIGDGNISYRP